MIRLRITGALTGALMLAAGIAQVVIVPGVYNTGLGVGGVALSAGDGQIDAHYFVEATGAHALTYNSLAYFQDGSASRTKSISGSEDAPSNSITSFFTTFYLTVYKASTASLSGQALADNVGAVFYEWYAVAMSGVFSPLTSFEAHTSFIDDVNTLTFKLYNKDGPQAFQITDLAASADVSAIPEPEAWLMLAGVLAWSALRCVGDRARATLLPDATLEVLK